MTAQVKPLIHLFQTPGGYYFFETNRHEIVSTSKEAYGLLNKMMDPDEDSQKWLEHQVLRDIQEMGYLSANRPKVIEHPLTSHLSDYLDRKLGKLTLQVTQECNLRCKYCAYSAPIEGQQRTHAARHMSWDTAKKALDFAQAHSQDSDDLNIGFYGGEPLLARKLLEQVIVYAKEIFLGKKLSFSMTTNGTLLSDEMIAFCQQHDIMLMISLDGPQEIHDKNRVMANGTGSFVVILENIQHLREHYPEYYRQTLFNMVIDPQNDFDCSNQVFIDHPMFEKGQMQATLVDDRQLAAKFDIPDSFRVKQEYNQFLSFLHEAGIVSDADVLPLTLRYTKNLTSKMERHKKIPSLWERMAPGGPCLPGVIRAMVDVDGKLFPCERCSEVSPVMTIGTIEDGFDISKALRLLNVGSLTAEQCRNCWAMLQCTCCASQIEEDGELSVKKKLSKCERIRNGVDYEFAAIAMLHELSRMGYKQGDDNNTVTVLGGVS